MAAESIEPATGWKVVAHDNYDRDYISESLHSEGYGTEGEAQLVADQENAKGNDYDMWHYVVKPASYKLYTWEP